MNTKGQGALEYLLIIGGAVIVAGIVLAILVGTSTPLSNDAKAAALDATCAKFAIAACPAGDPDGADGGCLAGDCEWDGSYCKGERDAAGTSTRSAACFP